MKTIINQFNKIGDILISIPMSRELIKDGHTIVYPVYKHMLNLQKHFPDIEFIDMNELDIDYESRELVTDGDKTIFPLRFSNTITNSGGRMTGLTSKSELYNKYFNLDIEFDIWRDLTWERDIEKEKELSERLMIKEGEKYNIINENYAGAHKREIKVDNGYKNIYMEPIEGFSILDWSYVIENATTIYTVVTSLLIMAEILNLNAKELHMYKRPHEIDMINVNCLITKNWIPHK